MSLLEIPQNNERRRRKRRRRGRRSMSKMLMLRLPRRKTSTHPRTIRHGRILTALFIPRGPGLPGEGVRPEDAKNDVREVTERG